MADLMVNALVLMATILVTGATQIGSTSYLTYCQSVLAGNQHPKTCMDLLCRGFTSDGIYTIYPTGSSFFSMNVYCDQNTDGGGWTVFQRRMDGSVDFYRYWHSYKYGFGEPNGEHWLGLDKLVNVLRVHPNNELRVDLEAISDRSGAYAKYRSFNVGDESSDYTLMVSGYNGTAGDSLTYSSGSKFTTRDRDNDQWRLNCAVSFQGAWWYKDCHLANLNGLYLNGTHSSYANGVNWKTYRGYNYSLKRTEMKIRGQL